MYRDDEPRKTPKYANALKEAHTCVKSLSTIEIALVGPIVIPIKKSANAKLPRRIKVGVRFFGEVRIPTKMSKLKKVATMDEAAFSVRIKTVILQFESSRARSISKRYCGFSLQVKIDVTLELVVECIIHTGINLF